MVLFNPNIKFVMANLNNIFKSTYVKNIVLIDNSSSDYSSLFNFDEKVKYIGLKRNIGIAAAQNLGIKFILEKKTASQGILFFDQDSTVTTEFVNLLSLEFFENYNSFLGILSPTIVEHSAPKPKNKIILNEVGETISSGSIISSNCLSICGLMEEELFIDYVDFEFCWRIRKFGFKIYKSDGIYLKHKVGNKIIKFFGKNIYVPAPFRHYYKYRNGTYLLKKEYTPLYWKKRERIIRLLTPIFVLLLFDNKLERFKYIWKGYQDGKCWNSNSDIQS